MLQIWVKDILVHSFYIFVQYPKFILPGFDWDHLHRSGFDSECDL